MLNICMLLFLGVKIMTLEDIAWVKGDSKGRISSHCSPIPLAALTLPSTLQMFRSGNGRSGKAESGNVSSKLVYLPFNSWTIKPKIIFARRGKK